MEVWDHAVVAMGVMVFGLICLGFVGAFWEGAVSAGSSDRGEWE